MDDAADVLRPTWMLRLLSAVGTAAGVAAAVSYFLQVMDGAGGVVTATVAAIVALAIGVRHQTARVELDERGARVRNTFRRRDVPWTQVRAVSWVGQGGVTTVHILTFQGKAQLELQDGRRLKLSATTVFTHAGAAAVTAALRRTAGRAGVPVEPAVADSPTRPTG